MAYIGAEPLPGQNREVDDISSSFNGSTTAFTLQVSGLNVSPETANNILVNLGGVIQNPGTDYTIAASTITFTTAPAAGLSFFGLILGAGINTATVADQTIGTSKVLDNAITADKLAHTSVTAGSYTTADITVDAQGRITSAASGTISGAEIADQAVTNAKVNNSAAIAGTKISPDFGSQAISTTGGLSINGATVFNEAGADVDFRIEGDNNANLFYLDAGNDRVGIGLNNPNDTFHVFHATDNLVGRFESGDTGAGITLKDNTHVTSLLTTNGAFEINVDSGGDITGESLAFKISGSEKARFDSSGSLLMGTTSSAGFDSFGSNSGGIILDNVNSSNTLLLATHDTAKFFYGVDASFAYLWCGSNHPIKIATNNTERMRINSSGNVGIGTTSPVRQLHVNESAHVKHLLLDNGAGGSDVGTTPAIYSPASATLAFSGGSAERMRIAADGHIGIGDSATSPAHDIHIRNNKFADLQIENIANSGEAALTLLGKTSGGVVRTFMLKYDSGDNVRIGTPSPIHMNFETSDQLRMRISAGGNIGAPTGSNIYNVSDSRLKKNIATLDKGLTSINALRPVMFNWIDGFCDEEKDTLYGFIAQEVKAVDTNLVQQFGIDGSVEVNGKVIEDTIRVNEKFVIPMLVKAVQELSAEVETLKTKVAALESA